MSMPYTIYEAKLVQCDDRRERSLAAHNHLMHLPRVDSLLERLMNRLRAATSSAYESGQRTAVSASGSAKHPPALSN